MKFKSKIWMLPITAAGVFLVGCVLSYAVGAHTSASMEQLRAQDLPTLEAIVRVERGVEQFRLTLQSAAAEGDVSKLDEVAVLGQQTAKSLDELAAIEGKQPLAGGLRAPLDSYLAASLGATRAMLGKGDPADHVQRMQSSMAQLDGLLAARKNQAQAAVASGQDEVAAGVRRNLIVLLTTCAAALVALGVASRLIVRSVWEDLGAEPSDLGAAMQRIAEGDLTESPAIGGPEGSVGALLQSMQASLRGTVATIRCATDSIITASAEITSGNQDLSTRTEITAANLRRTSAAMVELTGSVGHSAEAAREADGLAETASQAARRGGAIVTDVVSSMDEISTASNRINEIIGVIDGIAFQTNILALNAAVEAARAGDQGRGFAVVAAEVRSLAQRCAQAAKEIKTLIGMAGDKVDSGTRLVKSAGEAMEEIVAGVRRVSETVSGISAASSEQSDGIGGVNGSVNELDRMTQQNAALVEQSAAAAASLREQAQTLSRAVAAFKLGAEVQG